MLVSAPAADGQGKLVSHRSACTGARAWQVQADEESSTILHTQLLWVPEFGPTLVGALVGAFVGSPRTFVRASPVFTLIGTLVGTLVGALVGACSRPPGHTGQPSLSICRRTNVGFDARRTLHTIGTV